MMEGDDGIGGGAMERLKIQAQDETKAGRANKAESWVEELI